MGVLVKWQEGLVGEKRHSVFHDNRHDYNAPLIEAPAMAQEQFDYDNQRQIDDAVLLQPAMLAFVIRDLKDRVKELEDRINDNRGNR